MIKKIWTKSQTGPQSMYPTFLVVKLIGIRQKFLTQWEDCEK